jgi:hypothetical protein
MFLELHFLLFSRLNLPSSSLFSRKLCYIVINIIIVCCLILAGNCWITNLSVYVILQLPKPLEYVKIYI